MLGTPNEKPGGAPGFSRVSCVSRQAAARHCALTSLAALGKLDLAVDKFATQSSGMKWCAPDLSVPLVSLISDPWTRSTGSDNSAVGTDDFHVLTNVLVHGGLISSVDVFASQRDYRRADSVPASGNHAAWPICPG